MATEKLVHIVDDDDGVRRSAAFMLKHAGYRVELHVSGVDFLKHAKSSERGCVLLDVRMPEMDGLQIQQEMVKRGIDMPVVILTGHGDIAVAVKAMRAGAVNFIEKPYEKEELLRAIEEAFHRLAREHDREMNVEIYRANMMEKLRVRSLSEALRIAFIAERAEDGVLQFPASVIQTVE
ncbi:MAG: response regulator [Sphingomonadales bacterium]|nr:response regulator [Sphingomonadales bacterium]